MLSSLLIVVAAVATSKMALAECPCYTFPPDDWTCEDSSLTSIPDCVPSNITTLSIETPTIPLVPQTIRRFTNLRKLFIMWFDDPQISKVFLSGHPNISTFSIAKTNLEYVDNEWFLFAPGIKSLYLYYNKIASLAADTFSSLPLLEEVFLSYNQLTTLPRPSRTSTSVSTVGSATVKWRPSCSG